MVLQLSNKTKYTQKFFTQTRKESDRLMNLFLIGFFLAGLGLAPFYDTWLVAIGVGGLSLLAYYGTRYLLPDADLYQYMLGAALGIFMAQYIYQMHGLFEMHFIAFIASAILITYQNWKLQIPLAAVVVIHHAVFGYLQFIGFEKIYFTQLEYMSMSAFVIHASLAALIFFICGLWAHHFRVYSERTIDQSFEIGRLQEDKEQKEVLLASEQKLAEANRELNMVFNTINDVIFSVDMKTYRLIQMSAACEKVYGYTPAEFYADPDLWNKLMHPDDRYILEAHNASLHAGKETRNQYRIIHKDGSIRWIDNIITSTMDENGKPLRLDGTSRDITEKKKAEAEIIALNESLEQKVKDRTAELEAVNKELEAFGYSVSHDLRAPLRVINGFGKLILKRTTDTIDAESKENLEVIMANAKHMGELIDDLLNFSRLGRAELSKSEVNMSNLVRNVVEEVKADNTNSKADVHLNILPEAVGDPVLIKQVWINLISNAVKYSRKKEKPVVEVGTMKTNGKLTYYVKDNGAGFDMAHADKLFQVFQRLHKVTEYEGTGVGLALAQRIVNKHGGKMWAEGKVDEGATFYFTLGQSA